MGNVIYCYEQLMNKYMIYECADAQHWYLT